MQGSSQIQLHFPFWHRRVLWPGFILDIVILFSVVIFLITRWSTWRRLSATTGRTSTSVRSLSTPRWSPSPWVSSTMINCPARFVQSQTSLSSSAANWRPQSPTRAQRFWSAQKFRSRVGGNPRVGKLFKFSSFIIYQVIFPLFSEYDNICAQVAPHDPRVSWIAVSASRTKRTPPGCTDLMKSKLCNCPDWSNLSILSVFRMWINAIW